MTNIEIGAFLSEGQPNPEHQALLRRIPRSDRVQYNEIGVKGMTKATAIDLASRNIRVSSVHPGPIDTEMRKAFTPEQTLQLVR